MEKKERFGFWLTSDEKYMVAKLAEIEGGLSQAALIRRLIRDAAKKNGVPCKVLGRPSSEQLEDDNDWALL